MNELTSAVTNYAGNDTNANREELRDASVRWANYVLHNNTSELLRLGLEISRSIANYLNEIECPDKGEIE